MDTTTLDQAMEAAYEVAVAQDPVQAVAEHTIAEHVTLEVQPYTGVAGPGFYVIGTVTVPGAHFTVQRVRNHGPHVGREVAWPAGGIEAATRAHVARCIAAGAAHVLRAGFGADEKVILLNKLLRAKDTDALATVPKLVALYAWMETVQAMAVAGHVYFPSAPWTFEEVIAE